MTKRLLAFTLVIVLCLAFAACGSSEPEEPDRAAVNETHAYFSGPNHCTFTLYDDGTAEALVSLEDYTYEGGTVLATYALNKMQGRFDNFVISGHFAGDSLSDYFSFTITDGEIDTSKSVISSSWDKSLTQEQYLADGAILSEEIDKIKTAIEEL